MKNIKILVVAALVASSLASCFVERPCRTECFWDHGRRVCERRCH